MSANARLLVALTILAFGGSRAAAQPSDVADLFPTTTLAYAELTNPAELSPQIAALLKGTVLEDGIAFIHKRKDAATLLMELNGKRELAGLGLLVCPEMLAEFKKFRGVAMGLLDFSETGDPEIALVVSSGDSAVASVAARAFLMATPALRKVGDVSKVPIFQYRSPTVTYDMTGTATVANGKSPTDNAHDYTFAFTPGLFVVGTSKRAIAPAIERFLDKEKSGLASTQLFKDAAVVHRQTGAFYFVNFPQFSAKFASANKARGGLEEPDAYARFKMMANPKAIKSIAGSLRLRDGGIVATAAISFDSTQKSPLLDFLSGPAVESGQLHRAERWPMLSFTASLPEKNRAKAAMGLLDALAKANGELGRLPSDVLADLEKKYALSAGDSLLGKIRAVTIVAAKNPAPGKESSLAPIVVLHTEDAATASAWEEFFPKLVAEYTEAKTIPQASSETIGSVKVLSLPGSGTSWNGAIHYARAGKRIAIGLDRKSVAQAATNEATAAPERKSLPLAPGATPVLVGAIGLADLFESPIELARPQGPALVPAPGLPDGNGPIPERLMDELKKSKKEFVGVLGALPPVDVDVQRSGSELRLELFLPSGRTGGFAPAIDAAANWLDRWGGTMGNPNAFGLDGRQSFDRE